jgi:hypothetical protein
VAVSDILGLAIVTVWAGCYCIAAIAWLAAFCALLRLARHRKPGVTLWTPRLAYFPPNIVFRPELLTEAGLLSRRRLGIFLAAFLAALAGGLGLGALMRYLP